MGANTACTSLTPTVCYNPNEMGEVIVSNSGKLSVRDSSHLNLPQSISESLQVSNSPDKKG